jgi:uncharacterized protein (TIGR02611 family)
MTQRAAAPRKVSDALSGVRSVRARVRAWPGGHVIWRTGVTLAGALVIVIGIVLLPLPGPGWLIIFAGLGLLATEYEWAARLLRWARGHLTRWTRWAARQPLWARAGLTALGTLVLVAIGLGSWFAYDQT